MCAGIRERHRANALSRRQCKRGHADERAAGEPVIDPRSVLDMQTGIRESCAFCGSRDVAWTHPLAENLVAYRAYGKGHTLPSSWALCDRCEMIYASGDDDAAVDVMRSSAWAWVGRRRHR